MPAPLIQVRTQEASALIEVRRGAGVLDEFWLVLRAEWGSSGSAPARAIIVPVEIFLSRRAWLLPACRRYQVGVEWDDRSEALIVGANQERKLLDEALSTSAALTFEEIRARLVGGRFVRPLLPFQERDLARLLAMPHGANFSVPGAGKTTVAYATYEAERLAGRVEQMLVVAPLSAHDAWTEEAKRCFKPVPVVTCFDGRPIGRVSEVVLANYHRLLFSYEDVTRWAAARTTLVILDEAHRMKRGRSGQWGAACLNLAYLARRRDLLTGTPAPQSIGDLEALLDFLWPTQSRRILPADALGASPPDGAAARVADAIRPLFVRTTKNELGLRPPDYSVIEIPLEGIQAEIYAALRDQYASTFRVDRRDRITFAKMGEVVMYLLEAATNPALLTAGSSRYDPIEFKHPPLEVPQDSRLTDLLAKYGKYETPPKLVALAQLVEANARESRKTLVWSNFVRNLSTLERILSRYRPAVIHGGIPSEITEPTAVRTREAELARFKDDPECMVLLANPAATSEGVNLHDVCHDAVYLDRTFNAGQYLQSVDRIHRLGLAPDQRTVVTFLITTGTIDETVNRQVERKAAQLGDMLEDPDIVTMALPDDEDYGPPIESVDDDIAALFAHLRGENVD